MSVGCISKHASPAPIVVNLLASGVTTSRQPLKASHRDRIGQDLLHGFGFRQRSGSSPATMACNWRMTAAGSV
jgi:hypothetical protein